MSTPARLRPLLVRPGARFVCAGDGLCCTDIHALGPVSLRESEALPLLPADALVVHPGLRARVLRTESGLCAQLGSAGCRLHAQGGPEAKPASCRRFPFGLVATPVGGRITTQHRCPCRTLGERPALHVHEAEASLRGPGGKLVADMRVHERVRIAGRRTTSFARYLELEASLIAQLLEAKNPLEALDVAPFPELDSVQYSDVAHHLRESDDGTRSGAALAFAGDILLGHVEGRRMPLRERPWKDAFDRAEARSKPTPRARVLGDFLADSLYSLRWTESTSLHGAKIDLATRGLVASLTSTRLERAGARSDRAMAEGVMIAELLGLSGAWSMVISAFDRR